MTIVSANSNLRQQAAFTLVEVILAIVLALGILVVLLYFYQQATSLRTQILQETEHLAAARLLMDRITGELRTVQPEADFSGGFIGQSNSIQFVKADVPAFTAWMGGALGRSAFPVSDLKLVRYRLELGDGTNGAGLLRTEEPLVPKDQPAGTEDADFEAEFFDLGAATPVLEEIRFLQFRYWNGTKWLNAWSSSGLPSGVEVSLGAEAQTNETDAAESPAEVFRRVIYLAGSAAAGTGPETIPSQSTSNSTGTEDSP